MVNFNYKRNDFCCKLGDVEVYSRIIELVLLRFVWVVLDL